MPVTLVLGALFGDEGKGRVAHALAAERDVSVVCRFNGGANAAHTVIHNDEKITLRQLPCGLLHGKTSLIGDGMVLQLDDLVAELDALRKRKLIDARHLFVSTRAHIVLPTHKLLDKHSDEAHATGTHKHKHKRIGTTQMGVGPALVDKVSRMGLRIADLDDSALVKERLREHARAASVVLGKKINAAQLERDLMKTFKKVKPHVVDTHTILRANLVTGHHVLVEGAQGTFLDVAWGGYPYVTSTHPTTGGALAALGVSPKSLGAVVGVTRAYTTRQSRGPLPTEIPLAGERAFREATKDYAMRVGWLDMVLVRHAASLNGFTELLVTGVDKLAGLDVVRICTGWRLSRTAGPSAAWKGGRVGVGDDVPAQLASLVIEPEYEDHPGWPPFDAAHGWTDVPAQAKRFLDRIEELAQTPIHRLSASRAGPLLERGKPT